MHDASIEHQMLDYKIATCDLKTGKLNKKCIPKIVKTLTAMVNTHFDQTGYVILGVADTEEDARKYEELFSVTARQYSGLFITGIDAEANGDTDGFVRRIVQEIEQEPIPAEAKSEICRNMQILNYYGHTILVFSLQFNGKILSYDGVYYERHGSTLYDLKSGSEEFDALLTRFAKFTTQQANSSVDKATSTPVKESHAF